MSLAEDPKLREQFRRASYGGGVRLLSSSCGAMPTEAEAREEENENYDPVQLVREAITNQSKFLDLAFFRLKMLPEDIISADSVQVLDLQANFLEELPPDFGLLTCLQKLNLKENRLQSVPPTMCMMDMLVHLDLSNNLLRDLPPELEDLQSLQVLNLDFNYFAAVPECVPKLKNLTTLYFVENAGLVSMGDPNNWVGMTCQMTIDNSPELIDWYEASKDMLAISVSWNKIWPDQVMEGLFISSLRATQNMSVFSTLNVTHVLTCGRNLHTNLPSGTYQMVLEVDDNDSETLNVHFEQAIKFISDAITAGGSVLVHCFAGVSRSATVCVAYLIKVHHKSMKEAMEILKSSRPAVNPNPNFIRQLIDFEHHARVSEQPQEIQAQ